MKRYARLAPEKERNWSRCRCPRSPPTTCCCRSAAAICGTDIHITVGTSGQRSGSILPMTFGHDLRCCRGRQPGKPSESRRSGGCREPYPAVLLSVPDRKPARLRGYRSSESTWMAASPSTRYTIGVPGSLAADIELGALMEPMGAGVHGLLVIPEAGSVGIVRPDRDHDCPGGSLPGRPPSFVFDVNLERLAMAQKIVPRAIAINPPR